MKINIYVGHGKSDKGGYDSGAVNAGLNLHEFKIAREIAKAVDDTLDGYECDSNLYNYSGDMTLRERIAHANKSNTDLVVEIHLNAHSDKSAKGTEVWYYQGDIKGQKVADDICKGIASELKVVDRGEKGTTYFGIVRETHATAVLVEACFITNDIEASKVDTIWEQRQVGKAIGEAIAKTYGLVEKKAVVPVNQEYYIWCGKFGDKASAEKCKGLIGGLEGKPYCEVRRA